MSTRSVGLLFVLLVTRLSAPATVLGAVPDASACGLHAIPPVVYDHVVWIWLENHGYAQIVGSGEAPFLNRTLIPRCGLATNYHALGHPSLPNYIAATSGLTGSALAPFAHDCNAKGPCRIGAANLFAQAPSWGAYAESMRRPCLHWFSAPYAASHNPAVYYRSLADCPLHDRSLRALQPDLDADRLPAFSFITPNLCHSMHSCAVRAGDVWLRHVVARLTSSPAYAGGAMAIFITFDESEPDSGDSRVATIVVSPTTVPGTRSHGYFTHYALLRTAEEMLGLDAFLGGAAHARSMRAAFNL